MDRLGKIRKARAHNPAALQGWTPERGGMLRVRDQAGRFHGRQVWRGGARRERADDRIRHGGQNLPNLQLIDQERQLKALQLGSHWNRRGYCKTPKTIVRLRGDAEPP